MAAGCLSKYFQKPKMQPHQTTHLTVKFSCKRKSSVFFMLLKYDTRFRSLEKFYWDPILFQVQ